MMGQKRAFIALAVAGCALATVAIRVLAGGDSHTAQHAAPTASATVSASGSSAIPSTTGPADPAAVSQASTKAAKAAASASAAKAAAARAQERAASVPDVAALTAGLTKIFGGGNAFSVAGLDLTTGQSVTAGATSGMTEASVVKLDILSTALYQAQQGRSYSETDAEEMMEQSDNVAADQVFQGVGGNAALDAYNAVLGLTATSLDASGVWGLSVTSAADQLKLMRALVSSNSPLNAASRQHALQLMGDVEADQDWGVSVAADKGADTQLKNGWLNIDSDGGLWAVNSAGLTTSGGDAMLLVVLSQHNPDYQTGVDRVQAGAQLLAAALN